MPVEASPVGEGGRQDPSLTCGLNPSSAGMAVPSGLEGEWWWAGTWPDEEVCAANEVMPAATSAACRYSINIEALVTCSWVGVALAVAVMDCFPHAGW